MTAPSRGTQHPHPHLHLHQHASAIAASQASQNTAPVAEFRCLFTHDVRRKQKRWQDGFLKFHSFNNRVMVYDQARNFLGDTYYKDGNELHEGDELSLDKGVMIEVAEALGVTQTDLTALLERRPKEPPPRPAAASQPRPFQRPTSVAPANPQRHASQLRHKSLNTLLGTPKGPMGKAQLAKSPYETRQEKENDVVEERASKRQKIVQSAPAWRASSPVQEPSPIPKKSAVPVSGHVDARATRPPAKFIPPSAAVIVIDSEPETLPAITSDVTLPGTPPRVSEARSRPIAPAHSAIPTFTERAQVHTPRIPRGKVPVPHVKAAEIPRQSAPTSSPPVSATNRLENVDLAVQPSRPSAKEAAPVSSLPRDPRVKSLRLSVGVKRGTLLCQALPQQRTRAREDSQARRSRDTSRSVGKEMSPVVLQSSGKSSRKVTPTSSTVERGTRHKRERSPVKDGVPRKRARVPRSPPRVSPDVDDDPAVVHGLMDQQLLVLSPPVSESEAHSAVKNTTPLNESSATHSAARKDSEGIQKLPSKRKPIQAAHTKKNSEGEIGSTSNLPKHTSAPIVHATLPTPILEPPALLSRGISPAYSEASETRSRTGSTSPGKKALSTGGFRKKPSRATKQASSALRPPEIPPQSLRHETVALPPHPLRANRKGPLMSTTELAALLQEPVRKQQDTNDPFEDEASGKGKSPTRNFRRVRSENDAPIPSTAENWEKRNLPKLSSDTTNITEPDTSSIIVVGAKEPPKKRPNALSALIKKTDPRRKFQRTQSLSVDTANMQSPTETDPVSPVVDQDIGPWSTDAFDLFDWRPPRRGALDSAA
ncbi:hypothetical protein ACN47E_006718 [Coniothyrium glycines]